MEKKWKNGKIYTKKPQPPHLVEVLEYDGTEAMAEDIEAFYPTEFTAEYDEGGFVCLWYVGGRNRNALYGGEYIVFLNDAIAEYYEDYESLTANYVYWDSLRSDTICNDMIR